MLNCCLVQICEGCVVALRWKDISPYWTRNMFIFLFLLFSFGRIVLFISSIFYFFFASASSRLGHEQTSIHKYPNPSHGCAIWWPVCVCVSVWWMRICVLFPCELRQISLNRPPQPSLISAHTSLGNQKRCFWGGLRMGFAYWFKSKGFNVRLWLKQILLLGCASILH